jgi:tetratricopeptide (TPR) repeat protein
MKTALLFLIASAAWAQGARPITARLAHAPTDEKIQTYEKLLAAKPDSYALQSGLIEAYFQKLRETGDGGYLDRAAKLVDRMLASDGGHFPAMRFQNDIDLQKHDFAAVAERARGMLKYEPSDAATWGNLGDASMELGEYEQAGQAYARMFAIRPNLASYNRVAWLRFVTGDAAGAIAFMREAVEAGGSAPENTAWCWAELGDMYFKTGQLDQALQAYEMALDLFPALHRALAGKGRVQAERGETAAAIRSYERAQAMVPMIDYAGALEDLYAKAGMQKKAAQQRDMIDAIAALGAAQGEKTNRNLALILADHGRELGRAVALMEAEIPVRGDVYTYDALSWVLFKAGRVKEAQAASAKAMQWNTPEPLFRYHAREIAKGQAGE